MRVRRADAAAREAAGIERPSAPRYFGTSNEWRTVCAAPTKGVTFARRNCDATQSPSFVPAYGGSRATLETLPSFAKVTEALPGPVTPPSFLQNARTPLACARRARAALSPKALGSAGVLLDAATELTAVAAAGEAAPDPAAVEGGVLGGVAKIGRAHV